MQNYLMLGILWLVITFGVVVIATLFSAKKGAACLIALYTALVIIAAITATKIITICSIFGFSVTVPAGVLVFSATFLITDIVSEVWDRQSAEIAVWCGFIGLIFYAFYTYLSVIWPSAIFWENQQAYETIVKSSMRIAIAGPIAFLFSQNIDVVIYHYLKKREGNKKLWLRNNASTFISQFVDTTIFVTIAFYGIFPIWTLVIGQYLTKLFIALLDTPFMYLSRWMFYRFKKETKVIENQG
ncbi:MAG: queuosine precursor transporter [Candidatus Thermoplasmatota archaeon]|nr:queuosine precursor transporter [Candidatus Thermoplasmatota archaeon]